MSNFGLVDYLRGHGVDGRSRFRSATATSPRPSRGRPEPRRGEFRAISSSAFSRHRRRHADRFADLGGVARVGGRPWVGPRRMSTRSPTHERPRGPQAAAAGCSGLAAPSAGASSRVAWPRSRLSAVFRHRAGPALMVEGPKLSRSRDVAPGRAILAETRQKQALRRVLKTDDAVDFKRKPMGTEHNVKAWASISIISRPAPGAPDIDPDPGQRRPGLPARPEPT